MQQFRPFSQTDKMKKAEPPETPFALNLETAAPFTTRSTSQLLMTFPGEFDPVPAEDPLAPPPDTQTPPGVRVPTSLLSALQTSALASKPVRRPLVIHADAKRKKKSSSTGAPARHMSRRLRQTIILLVTVLVFGTALLTLAPLAAGQNVFNISSGISFLIHTAQNGWQVLSQQNNSQNTASNGKTTLPPMTIPHSQLVTIAEQDATAAGINPTYFVRQINLESGFNPNAVSPGGAEGIAQFEPATAAGLGIDPFNPTQALQAAAQMMARYYHQYGDYAKALASYNAGPATLQNAVNSCGANWLSCMPAETQHYVATIMGT